MKQTMEFTFEVEETITRRYNNSANQSAARFCPQCRNFVEMFAPPAAAALFGLSEREIFRLIENGQLHFVETERIFVCRNSLTSGANY